MEIRYISHGTALTGGYLMEQQLMNSLATVLQAETKEIRIPKRFTNWWQYLQLWRTGYAAMGGDLIIVPHRLAFPGWLYALLHGKKFILVVHYDPLQRFPAPNKLHFHFRLFSLFWKWTFRKGQGLIVTLPNWVNKIPLPGVAGFPNLYDPQAYRAFHALPKKQKIHLGMLTEKNDLETLSHLGHSLMAAGWICGFSSAEPDAPEQYKGIPVWKGLTQEVHLAAVADSRYTICLPKVTEGWGRIAHEAVLMGTTVIGNRESGLKDLLVEAGQLLVNDPSAIIPLIEAGKTGNPTPEFLEKYTPEAGKTWAQQLLKALNLIS